MGRQPPTASMTAMLTWFLNCLLLICSLQAAASDPAFIRSFCISGCHRGRALTPVSRVGLQVRGFGKPAPDQKSNGVKRAKSSGQVEREQAASTFDSMKQRGVPEYEVWLRVKGDTSDKNWIPVGSMAVPRTADVQTGVTRAIYESEEQLQSGAFRMFPKLKQYEEFEYGFRLVDFPDEEIRVANKEDLVAQNEKSGLVQLFENFLLNPLNTDDQQKPN